MPNKITIGFITYEKNTAKYLPYFLKSIFAQTYKDFNIIATDNSKNEKNENSKYIKKNYPQIDLQWSGKNIGFSVAYNKMIKTAIEKKSEYFLAINPDMILDAEMLKQMIKTIELDNNIGAISPKILKWNFKNKEKTNIIDSYGLSISENFCFYDIDQGKKDYKFTDNEKIFGFTGAAVLFRLKALQDVKFKQEYFDELMFMYKEDCDLSTRLYLAGWDTVFEPKAISYHDRTAGNNKRGDWGKILNRKNKNKQVKKWSFLNHWIILSKYKNISNLPVNRIKIIWYQFKSLIFITIFEPYLLKELISLYKLKNKIKVKSKWIYQ